MVNNHGVLSLLVTSLAVLQAGSAVAAHAPAELTLSPASALLWGTAVLALSVRLATAD
jgi:hypothetical protein